MKTALGSLIPVQLLHCSQWLLSPLPVCCDHQNNSLLKIL